MKKLISIILVVTMVLATIPAMVSEEPEILLGDINYDGVICYIDAVLALHFVAELPTRFDNDERALKASLVRGTPEVNETSISDVIHLLMYLDKVPAAKLSQMYGVRSEFTCECCYDCSLCEKSGTYLKSLEDYCYCESNCLIKSYPNNSCKIYAQGNVNGDCTIDIKDALQTLMYVAGMPSSTLNDSDENLQAALITDKAKETGEPTIGDVLQILMYVASMPASLLNEIN